MQKKRSGPHRVRRRILYSAAGVSVLALVWYLPSAVNYFRYLVVAQSENPTFILAVHSMASGHAAGVVISSPGSPEVPLPAGPPFSLLSAASTLRATLPRKAMRDLLVELRRRKLFWRSGAFRAEDLPTHPTLVAIEVAAGDYRYSLVGQMANTEVEQIYHVVVSSLGIEAPWWAWRTCDDPALGKRSDEALEESFLSGSWCLQSPFFRAEARLMLHADGAIESAQWNNARWRLNENRRLAITLDGEEYVLRYEPAAGGWLGEAERGRSVVFRPPACCGR